MRWLRKWFKRGLALTLVLILGLLAPVLWVETMCTGDTLPEEYIAILPPSDHRPETRTLLTYPEWHIVHAYDDYAEVIRTGDPHQYGFLQGISGFWSSLCVLKETSSAHGDINGATRQMVYVIGVSFTAELLLKAAYEETLGRLFAALRGSQRAPLDDLSARQAAGYAQFLQQVPWYKWDFRADAAALRQAASDRLRDRERRLALGLEYGAKAAYAGVIARAVAATGQDQLRLKMVVSNDAGANRPLPEGVNVVDADVDRTIIDTPRYRALTHLMQDMVDHDWRFHEIAGNDDIMFTAISPNPSLPGAVFSFPRQGYGDYRHLMLVKVSDLAEHMKRLKAQGVQLEHIHDY